MEDSERRPNRYRKMAEQLSSLIYSREMSGYTSCVQVIFTLRESNVRINCGKAYMGDLFLL